MVRGYSPLRASPSTGESHRGVRRPLRRSPGFTAARSVPILPAVEEQCRFLYRTCERLAAGARFVSSLAQGLMRRRFAGLCVPEVRIASYLPSALTGSDHQRVLLSARDDLAVRSGSRPAV